MPQISVIIPTYNRADLLPLTIESVMAQTMPDWELIIVDDGSTDETATVLAPFLQDERIRYIRQENAGRSAARNHGARLARGDYFYFLDSDDELRLNSLTAHLAALINSAFSIGGYRIIDAQGRPQGKHLPWQTAGALDLRG